MENEEMWTISAKPRTVGNNNSQYYIYFGSVGIN